MQTQRGKVMICKITNPSDKISSSEMNFRLSKMKMSVLKCTLCLLLVFALTGCMGIIGRITGGRLKESGNKPDYFTSTRYTTFFGLYDFPYSTIPAVIDLPFSLAADTVCFPFEVVIDIHRNYRETADRKFWETYFATGASLSTPDEGRRHLSSHLVILENLHKPLPKHQLMDLIRIGLAKHVARYKILDKELFELCFGGDISKGIPDNDIAATIAENKGTSAELLEIMIRSRAALPQVIKNPNTTPQMLHEISEITESLIYETKHTEESDKRVRDMNLISKIHEALAENTKTPQADLELLYPSDSHSVIINLTRNPNTSDAVLCRIFADLKSDEYKKRDVSIYMASRASVPAEVQNFIVTDSYENTKALLIQNKAVLPEIRSALLIQPNLIAEFCKHKLLSPAQVKQLFDEASPDIQAVMRENKTIMSYIDKAKKE